MVTERRLGSEKQTRFSRWFLILQQAEERDQVQAGWAGARRLQKSPCGGNEPSWVWLGGWCGRLLSEGGWSLRPLAPLPASVPSAPWAMCF